MMRTLRRIPRDHLARRRASQEAKRLSDEQYAADIDHFVKLRLALLEWDENS